MIQEIPSIKKSQRQEVWHYLNETLTCNKSQSSVKYINCANGILDLENMQLVTHSPDFLILNKIPTKFNPDAKSDIVDAVLLKLSNGNERMKLLLEEILGYCLYRRNELGKFFVLTGEGGGGKSTYLDMITKVLGEVNVSSVSLHNLSERFQNTEIVGKLANIGDDISDKYIDDNSDIKKLATGEAIQFEEKGQKPFRFRSYAKLLFASNRMPRINDMSDGLMRRIVTVPFMANFTRADDYDPFIIDKLTTPESLEYFLLLGVEGLKRILVNRAFTVVDEVVAENKNYEKLNNPILQFIDDGYRIENEENKSVYMAYTVWCQENGHRAVSSVVFGREICRRLNLSSNTIKIDGRNKRIYQSKTQ
jgi:putative DNA primase/helicase